MKFLAAALLATSFSARAAISCAGITKDNHPLRLDMPTDSAGGVTGLNAFVADRQVAAFGAAEVSSHVVDEEKGEGDGMEKVRITLGTDGEDEILVFFNQDQKPGAGFAKVETKALATGQVNVTCSH